MSSASPADESRGATVSSTGHNDGQQMHAQHACVTCAQRKVKCDRLQPCSNCERAKIDCEYRDPAPPRRRKRKQPLDEETLAKLERYEKLLNQLGVDVGSPAASNGDARSTADPQADSPSRKGSVPTAKTVHTDSWGIGRKYIAAGRPEWDEKLIIDGNRVRYVENNLWGSLSENVDHSREGISTWDDPNATRNCGNVMQQTKERGPASLLFGNNQILSQNDLSKLHPPVDQKRRMWFFFRENVDPLIKLFDINIKERMFLNTDPQVPEGNYRFAESFFFSIYFCAVTSLDDEECLKEFGETRSVLLDRYQLATEQTLMGGNLLNTSDTFVLQAFILYLFCMRHRADVGSIWILAGVAIRMAQRSGLHRDAEKIDGNIWPWNAELRRRLWWQIMMLDGRISELSGLGQSIWASFRWDAKQPMNLNDSDLNASASEFPQERKGATDMIFCSILYECSKGFRSLSMPTSSKPDSDIVERDAIVDEVEKHVEQKYLRYCDPLIPLHQLCLIITRQALASMRFKFNHPRRLSNRDKSTLQEQKNLTFSLALKVLEYYNLAHATKSIKKYMWFVRATFPWAQSVFLISELQHRISDSEADRAWRQLEEMYEHHPEVLHDQTKALHIAFANFALRAWDARIKEFAQTTPGAKDMETPRFIQILYQNRSQRNEDRSNNPPSQPPAENPAQGAPQSPLHVEGSAPGGQFPFPVEQDLSIPMVNYNSGLNADPNLYDWPQWDDIIFQDASLPLGMPLDLGQSIYNFGMGR